MPKYRVPSNLRERAELVAASLKPRSAAEKATLDLLHLTEAPDVSAFSAGQWIYMNFGSRGNRGAPPPCGVCEWISERACDRIIRHADVVTHGRGKSVRCSVPLCSWCTYEPEPGKDLCPDCVPLFKAWCAARTNSCDGEGPG